MSETKLKPCPCCGGEAKIDYYHPCRSNHFTSGALVYCIKCHLSIDTDSGKDCIDVWNTRTPCVHRGQEHDVDEFYKDDKENNDE